MSELLRVAPAGLPPPTLLEPLCAALEHHSTPAPDSVADGGGLHAAKPTVQPAPTTTLDGPLEALLAGWLEVSPAMM